MRRTKPSSNLSVPRRALGLLSLGSMAIATSPSAAAQIPTDLTFSVDFQGPLIGTVGNAVGTRINEGDILIRRGGPFNPETPQISRSSQFLTQYQFCSSNMPGISCGVEINALSYGRDARLLPAANYEFSVYLSVDEWAVGRPVPAGTVTPTIFTEALNNEAAGDVFAKRFVGMGPFGINPGQAVGIADGDGRASGQNLQQFIGLGLEEPIPPTPQAVDAGDNLDALDLGPPADPASSPLFFSLQASFPLCQEAGVALSDSAGMQPILQGTPNTAVGADVLVLRPNGQIRRYASAAELGLDVIMDGLDDIDALIVVENGVDGYQPPAQMYDWTGTNPTDVIFFSVRCGSDIIDDPDANFNVPITEGDILVKLTSQIQPGIFVAAEALGLETVSRGGMFNDELDGMDMVDMDEEPFEDCNMNAQEDNYDITDGTSLDADLNGIPDECEEPGEVFCGCETAPRPCATASDASSGCENGFFASPSLIGGGTSSVTTDSLMMVGSDLPASAWTLIIMGDVFSSSALGSGRLCIAAPQRRLSLESIDGLGDMTFGPGILGLAAGLPSPPAPPLMVAGTTWGFQAWYRDPSGSCGLTGPGALSNITNGVRVTLTP